MGSSLMTAAMGEISDWINHHSLIDLPQARAQFTWLNHQDPSSV